MAIAYTNIPEANFSGGIDVRSAENQIEQGFVLDLLNSDIVEKRARKRTGYQGYAGNLPVRVVAVDYDLDTTQVCFTLDSAVALDSAVSLEKLRSSPLVVYGRSSTFTAGQGPFEVNVDHAKYYDSFTIPTRKQFIAPSGTLAISASEHGLGTTSIMTEVVESTNVVNRSYEQIIPDSLEIDASSYDIDIDYTTFQNKNVFVYFLDNAPLSGSKYVATLSHTGSGSETFTVTAGTHNLSNFNIIAQFQEDNGATVDKVIPDQFLVLANGDVQITLNSISATTFYVLLSTTEITNTATGVVNAGSTGTVVLSDLENPWVFSGIYIEQTPGGTKELVLPDSQSYDDTTQELTLTFTNNSPTALNFITFYTYGSLRSNQLCVIDPSVTVNGSDTAPQLSIWGLDHEEIYISKLAREAWVNHVDSYRRSGEQRVISGLGGNLFSARTYAESATSYLYPLLYPNLNTRTSVNKNLGPLIWETSETPQRTRGYITSDNGGTHWSTVTSVVYDSGTGYTVYTLSLPNKQILDSVGIPTTLSSVVSTTSGLEDILTVQGMSYARHEGSFRIRQVVDGIDSIEIYVENDQNSADYDDTGVAGEAGVFTDQLEWDVNSPFLPGDVLLSEALGDTFICNVISSNADLTVLNGVTDLIQVPGGVVFTGRRISSLVPMRSPNPDSVSSTTNLVRGDMLQYTGFDYLNGVSQMKRLLRVNYINPDQDRAVDISTVAGVATVTLATGDTIYLTPGQKVVLLDAGNYTGEQVITDIISDTEFTFDSTSTDVISSATLLGEVVQLDENVEWADLSNESNFFYVTERWIPIEAPDDSYNLTPSTHIRYFDTDPYSDQEFIRSTMVVDNMYLENYLDEAQKLDGTNIYRAGIPDWQPGLFLTQETTGATIVTDLRSIDWTGAPTAIDLSAGRLPIDITLVNTIPVGHKVRLEGSLLTYTVRDYIEDVTASFILFDRSLDAAVTATDGTISEIGVYRYYFRLNAVDVNDNIVASAVTGYQDHVVELTGNAAVQLKLVGFPAWDNYDYDRLEVQIYRTKLNQVAPFYLITTLALDFDNTQGYVQFKDTFADSDLQQLDIVNTALKGAELGTQFQEPIRAKYVTSVANSLVLGNVRDYPQLDIQIVGPANLANTDFAGDSLLFRRSNTDGGTVTDMINRVRYEWINGFTGTASAFVIGSDQFSFTTSIATSAVPGDWIYLTYATTAVTGRQLDYCGWYQIASVSTTTVTVNLVGAAAATTYPNRYVIATDPTNVPVLLGVDGSLGMFNGDSFDTFDTMRRLSMAINSTMRMVDISITGMSTFKPWIMSRGGNDVSAAGKLIVRQPRTENELVELVPTFSGYNLFVNNVKRTSGDQISASTAVFGSRLLISYENYPEIFDNPTSILDTESESAVDINSADGQEMTGCIPFFGDSAFGAAQQSGIVVVFKTNSIYLVDVNQKRQGLNAVQKIETEGLGCTAPYSIASTKNGIMFANESGMYCLRRDLTIQYIGRYMERNWTERVDLEQLSIAQGTHYGIGRSYKLSVPIVNNEVSYNPNSEVYVYNHTAEDQQQLGSWGRYDAHDSVGWANLGSNAYWASTRGRVFSIRNTGQISDDRDDSSAIRFLVDTRPNDYGNSGIRKVLDKALVHYRNGKAVDIVSEVSYSVDLEEEYFPSTVAVSNKSAEITSISDQVRQAVTTIVHQTDRRRGIYFSLRIENNVIDQPIEIAGIDYKVGGLTEKGVTSAAQSNK